MYKITKSDFEKINEAMRDEMTRQLKRFILIMPDPEPEPVPEKQKRGRPKKNS